MSRVFDRPITIEKIDELTEKWTPVYSVHASVNKTKADNQYLQSGSTRTRKSLTFEVRYFTALEDIAFNLQLYRVVYNGVSFSLDDYDDYKLTHKTVKLLGSSENV